MHQALATPTQCDECGLALRAVPLRRASLAELSSQPLYLRSAEAGASATFQLYRAPSVPLTHAHLRRLIASGVDVVYIPDAGATEAGPSGDATDSAQAVPAILPRTATGGPDEKRRFGRFALWCPVTLEVHGTPRRTQDRPQSLRAQAFDVSRGGFGVLSPRPIETGASVILRLHAPGWMERGLHLRVVRCERIARCFELGLEMA